ncbi:RNA polymerase sigma factor [Ruminococcus albus]|uniref:RNA polymerase sigma factor n=1 Tax=Ruminococcus albus TaxID=1264 RepID=A0A1H7JPH4_RUMAL|nr:RNA polymerase sigma factor [Ruminococcus albus]SEK75355.1 RNA polymerase sigma-70 factor, ECF subfamily [Ruminococcus albus]
MKKNELIEMVEQLKAGNKNALKALYEEYYDRLYFFVLKNVDSKEAAEDITQDTFLKSMEKIDSLEKPENYVSWLHSIAYNRCTDMFRSRKSDVYFDTDEEFESAMESHSLNEPVMVPEDYATDKDRSRQLKAMIDSLKPDMKSALILYYYNDMSLADVAKTMGIPENTAKQKIFRARKKLKTKIEEMAGKGIVLSAIPMNQLLRGTVSPKKAAAMVTRSGASLSSVPLIGKIAGISAAAVIAVGVPVSLSRMDKNADIAGNVRVHDSSAVSAEANDSSTADTLASEMIEVSLSDTSAAKDTASRPENSKAEDTSSKPAENYAEPAPASNGIDVTAAVNTSAPVEPAPETADVPEEKKENQPVEMTPEKLLGMTNSQLRELSDNDFEVVLEPYSFNLVYGIRCKAFPNYVYIVDIRNEDGQPDGPLDAIDRWHGDKKIVLDSEEVRELIVQGNEPLGEGISVGMTYSQIKEVNGGLHLYNDGFAYPRINSKIWGLHFALTDEEQTLINEKFDELEAEYEGTTNVPMIDLTELGIDPVCSYAHIFNTYNGVNTGIYDGVFVDN